MASNLIIARGAVQLIPPISLAFWRWLLCFIILLPFTFNYFNKNFSLYRKELPKLFVLGLLGCGICGAFPFIAGKTTTIVNMGIIYSSSPIFIILISYLFFNEKININRFLGILISLIGVIIIIIKDLLEKCRKVSQTQTKYDDRSTAKWLCNHFGASNNMGLRQKLGLGDKECERLACFGICKGTTCNNHHFSSLPSNMNVNDYKTRLETYLSSK